MKTYLITWVESEIAGVKKFCCDLNLGENSKEAIHNQLVKNAKRGVSSYDLEAVELDNVKTTLSKYGFTLIEPKTEEKEIKPKIEKHDKKIEEDDKK